MSCAHSVARSCAQPAARAVNARWGSSSTLPRLDPGEAFAMMGDDYAMMGDDYATISNTDEDD